MTAERGGFTKGATTRDGVWWVDGPWLKESGYPRVWCVTSLARTLCECPTEEGAELFVRALDALAEVGVLAERTRQAEQERDEWKRLLFVAREWGESVEAQLAASREALRDIRVEAARDVDPQVRGQLLAAIELRADTAYRALAGEAGPPPPTGAQIVDEFRDDLKYLAVGEPDRDLEAQSAKNADVRADAEALLTEWLGYTGLRRRAFDPELDPDDDEYASGRSLVTRTDAFLEHRGGAHAPSAAPSSADGEKQR